MPHASHVRVCCIDAENRSNTHGELRQYAGAIPIGAGNNTKRTLISCVQMHSNLLGRTVAALVSAGVALALQIVLSVSGDKLCSVLPLPGPISKPTPPRKTAARRRLLQESRKATRREGLLVQMPGGVVHFPRLRVHLRHRAARRTRAVGLDNKARAAVQPQPLHRVEWLITGGEKPLSEPRRAPSSGPIRFGGLHSRLLHEVAHCLLQLQLGFRREIVGLLQIERHLPKLLHHIRQLVRLLVLLLSLRREAN
mmetsp:Transcript_34495/g.85856  ORF Transcript_34495/g.85856 Transcript_34495/m.85856 type:complete len:253 (+) Transcript_34495:171-929(+)